MRIDDDPSQLSQQVAALKNAVDSLKAGMSDTIEAQRHQVVYVRRDGVVLPVKNPGGSAGEVSLTTTELPIKHMLGVTPRAVSAIPFSVATVYQTRQPDKDYIYLAASVACDAMWSVRI